LLKQGEITGDFKEEVAPKENSCRESELFAGNGQFPIHRQRCKPHVDSVDEGYDLDCKQERQQPELQLANGSGIAYSAGHCISNRDGQIFRNFIVVLCAAASAFRIKPRIIWRTPQPPWIT
jgi:hypothetical protein